MNKALVWGVVCTLAVTGTGGPYENKPSRVRFDRPHLLCGRVPPFTIVKQKGVATHALEQGGELAVGSLDVLLKRDVVRLVGPEAVVKPLVRPSSTGEFNSPIFFFPDDACPCRPRRQEILSFENDSYETWVPEWRTYRLQSPGPTATVRFRGYLTNNRLHYATSYTRSYCPGHIFFAPRRTTGGADTTGWVTVPMTGCGCLGVEVIWRRVGGNV
eukprot:4240433-Pyramimonas_sp.AAC.3